MNPFSQHAISMASISERPYSDRFNKVSYNWPMKRDFFVHRDSCLFRIACIQGYRPYENGVCVKQFS